jgi:C-terminal processing protease CtpA/Prc
VIERIDGVNTRGRPLWKIRLELFGRQQRGEDVQLAVLDRRVDERRVVRLEAGEWAPEVAAVEEVSGARVMTVHSLPAGASVTLSELACAELPDVVDLRPLVWGSEDEAIAAADVFVGEGRLGAWRGRRAGEESFAATAEGSCGVPRLVLVGPDTECGGEVLAAALQGAGATLVGHSTSGRARHMRLIHDGDLHLWLPVAQWLRADDEPIDGNGVQPDEEVAVPEGEAQEDADPVLQRALELLEPELSFEAAA